MMAWAALFGSLSMYFGLLISFYFNLAAGSSIILVAIAIFFIVFILQNLRQRRTSSLEEVNHG
jgi:ABC-type Mn2+/Zn2+ transport system permease subunit